VPPLLPSVERTQARPSLLQWESTSGALAATSSTAAVRSLGTDARAELTAFLRMTESSLLQIRPHDVSLLTLSRSPQGTRRDETATRFIVVYFPDWYRHFDDANVPPHAAIQKKK